MIDRHERPKETWTRHDWLDHIEDARKMLALAQANPKFLTVSLWETELAKRTKEYQSVGSF